MIVEREIERVHAHGFGDPPEFEEMLWEIEAGRLAVEGLRVVEDGGVAGVVVDLRRNGESFEEALRVCESAEEARAVVSEAVQLICRRVIR